MVWSAIEGKATLLQRLYYQEWPSTLGHSERELLTSIKLFKSRIIWFMLVQRLWLNNFYWGFVMFIELFKSRIIWFKLVQRRSLLNNFYWVFNWMTHHVNLSVEDGQQIIQVVNNLILLDIMGCNGQVLFWALIDWHNVVYELLMFCEWACVGCKVFFNGQHGLI